MSEISLNKLQNELKKGKYHLSKLKIDKLKLTKQEKSKKPKGIWYSSNQWIKHNIQFNYSETHKYMCCFIYKISLNKKNITTNINDKTKSKILAIKTIKKLDEFIKKYEYKNPKPFYNINWNLVSKDFKGIEFIPYLDIEKEKNILSIDQYFRKKKISKKGEFIDDDYYWNIYYEKYYLKSMGKYLFYEILDVESGCIWDPSIMDNFELLYKKKNKKWFIE